MTEEAKKFIYLLEREKAPMQEGYYYFDSGIFSNPSWYRLNNRISQWQITFDLVKWYNVSDITIELNIENLYIVNYLKIKEIKNNIVIMNKNNEDFLNTMCNNIYIDVSKYQNEYNDNTISDIIKNINEANDNIINIKTKINSLELDYELRANKKNLELLKRELIYWNTQYHYLMEDYYKRLMILKSNCINNTDMVLGIYKNVQNELELMKNALSISETKYNEKCNMNKQLNDELQNNKNYNIEQSMKMTALEMELKDKNDIIKNLKNDINISLNNFTLNLDNRINSLHNENKMYKNKISNLESKIDSNVNDNLNYKNLINNLQNKIKFYEDEEKHFSSNNEISKIKINQLELSKFNLERANEKLKIQTQNCISNEDNLQKEMLELREKLCVETVNKNKIINDAQLLLNTKYTWNAEKEIFEENDFEILE